MNTAIYVRVSTEKQESENQLVELRAYAQRQGLTIVHEFADTITGGTSDRPQFNAMFQSAERKEFELLLFWSMDRLTREGTLVTLQHLDRLSKVGVGYKSMQESYLDTANPFHDVFIALAATKAREEKKRISERTKAGLARVRVSGSKSGKSIGGQATIDRSKVLALRALGHTQAEIAHELSCSTRSINRIERAA